MPRDVELGETLEAFLAELVASGRYSSADEAVREALNLLRQREAAWATLEADLQKGLDSLDAGQGLSADEVFDELISKYERMAKERGLCD
jgi:antitoxin ParD1/3/4